jgi:trimeric autotransporter adhesin
MKTPTRYILIALILLALSIFNLPLSPARAQGTAFSYQGRLNEGNGPANGYYDLQFILFSTSQFGFPAAPILTNAAVLVNNGLFTTMLNFGSGVFTGTNYWLDISVRTNGNGAFNELTPRQPITPAPYAITAETAETVNNLSGLTVQQNTNGSPNLIGGSPVNFVNAGFIGATIAGGGAINFDGTSYTNSVTSDFGTVSGGNANTAGFYGTVGGGGGNTSRGAEFATVGGGEDNTSGGSWATVPGGKDNFAGGDYSFAAGDQAQALQNGVFVWADDSGAGPFSSTANNQFLIRAGGGVGINTASPQKALSVVGGMNIDQGGQNSGNVSANALTFGSGSGEGIASQRTGSGFIDNLVLYTDFLPRLTIFQNGNIGIDNPFGAHLLTVGPGLTPAYCDGTTWVNASDRNSKEDFTVINPREVLEKISALPVMEWRYKVEVDGTKHIGPMAQDFHAAFGLNGADDKHISTVDESGVALAAIQGLNQKLDEKDSEIQTLKQQNDSLAKRLSELETAVKQFTAQK